MSSEGLQLTLDATRKSLTEIKRSKLVKEEVEECVGNEVDSVHCQFHELPDEVTLYQFLFHTRAHTHTVVHTN